MTDGSFGAAMARREHRAAATHASAQAHRIVEVTRFIYPLAIIESSTICRVPDFTSLDPL
jgi:hypothetical protein